MEKTSSLNLRIKEARINAKLTMEKAAELSNASLSVWKQYENGERLPSLPKLKNICLALSVQPEFLLETKSNIDLDQLKLQLDQLSIDDLEVIHAAVAKRIEVRNRHI